MGTPSKCVLCLIHVSYLLSSSHFVNNTFDNHLYFSEYIVFFYIDVLLGEFHGYVGSLLGKFPIATATKTPESKRSRDVMIPNYEGIAVCYIIILIKMLFGIDGQIEK